MSRIPALARRDVGLFGRIVYRVTARRYGAVPEPITVLAHHRGLTRASAVHELLVERASTALPTAVRSLVVYRTARLIGCSWCVDFGEMLQRLESVDQYRLAHIDDYRDDPAYSDDERAALAYADALTTDPLTAVTDAQVADLLDRFGVDGVLELTYQIGLENMRARMYGALGIVDQGFASGACRLPEGPDDQR